MTSTHLRLNRLNLRNFRCFHERPIEFHEDLTVLVAENGGGKTAILDAVGIALGAFVDAVVGATQFHGFHRTDVRLIKTVAGDMEPALPTEFEADGLISGQPVHWSRSLGKYTQRARSTTKGLKDLDLAARELRLGVESTGNEIADEAVLLPLVAFYGTGRLWSEHRLTESKRKYVIDPVGRLSGYLDCLSSSSSFKGAVAWYESKMREIGDPRYARELSKNVPLVGAVQEAVRVVLEPSGWRELNWSKDKGTFVVEHPSQGSLPLSMLSDGIRNMVALVVDISHRCARLNPDRGENAARDTPGILLIDEVDMHLHPRWQQVIVELLQKAFPSLQIVLTTHSPHVLSTINKESIRVIRIEDGESTIETPEFQTRGVESADVLAAVMRVDPVPQISEVSLLRRYKELIEDGQAEGVEARGLRERLVSHFGKKHPAIVECDQLIRFQAFKVKTTERKGP